MTTLGLVSVIVPARNEERFLADALNSILAQACRPLEILVIDDGSTDGTAAIVRRFPQVRYAYQPGQGLAAALNHGLRLATGACLAFLDGDDMWCEGKLAAQVEALAQDPALDAVFGHFRQALVQPDGSLRMNEPQPGFFKGTALIRRAAFDRVGGFDTRLHLGDFIDWYKRAKDAGLRMRMMPAVMLIRRVHGGNNSVRQRASRGDYVRIMKAALDRQRQGAAVPGAPRPDEGREPEA